jgi:hypothetical protein
MTLRYLPSDKCGCRLAPRIALDRRGTPPTLNTPAEGHEIEMEPHRSEWSHRNDRPPHNVVRRPARRTWIRSQGLRGSQQLPRVQDGLLERAPVRPGQGPDGHEAIAIGEDISDNGIDRSGEPCADKRAKRIDNSSGHALYSGVAPLPRPLPGPHEADSSSESRLLHPWSRSPRLRRLLQSPPSCRC